jgi:hypothetical protein
MAAEELQDAVIGNIEVIGEAAKRVSPEARNQLAGERGSSPHCSGGLRPSGPISNRPAGCHPALQ